MNRLSFTGNRSLTYCVFFAQDHIQEIFSTYGKIKMVEMPMDRLHPHLSRGSAYVEFETPEEAQKALKYMDGGWLNYVSVLLSYSITLHIRVE